MNRLGLSQFMGGQSQADGYLKLFYGRLLLESACPFYHVNMYYLKALQARNMTKPSSIASVH